MSATAEASVTAGFCRDFSEDPLDGLNIVPRFRDRGKLALSEYAACLGPLLEAMGWLGRARHLAEAVPHFSDNIDLDGFRKTLANLNIRSLPFRLRHDRINPGLLPCLFVPDKGSVRVVLGREQNGYRIYDGFTRSVRLTSGCKLRGTAYLVRAESESQASQAAQTSVIADLAARFSRLIVQLLLATLMLNILGIAMPIFMMSIYDKVIPSHNSFELVYLVAGVGLATLLERGFRKIRNRIMTFAAGRIDFLVGTAAFRQVLLMPTSMTENEPLGAQVSHLQEFESVREFFTGPLGETVLDMPFVVMFLAMIAAIAGWLALVPAIAALLMLGSALLAGPFGRKAFIGAGQSRGQQNRFLIETVSGMRAIRFAGASDIWRDRFRTMSAATASNDFRTAMFNHTVQTIGRILMLSSGVALVWLGAQSAMDKSLTIGALVAVMALSWRVLGPFQSALMLLNRGTQIRSSMRQINHLLRLKPERIPGKIPSPRTFRGRITFNAVSYRHGPDCDPALTGVTFQIEPGEVVAVTGPNGAGKSTLAKLATGLYQAPAGSVMIDGVDVRQMDPLDLRQHIGFVPQSNELLYGTVAQNFRLAVPTARDEEIIEAAKLADLHEAIVRLPQGYETRLTETLMTELPEGFKQKLSIARALLRCPPILIFDEPGQMLDESGDKAFIANVQRLRGRATIIIITHRPSHMRVADRLILLNAGRLQFNGPAAEALAKLEGAS